MNETLENYRKQIDEIDMKIAECFENRMDIVLKVAEYKQKNNLNTFDPNREKAMLEKEKTYIKNENLKDYYIKLLKKMLEVSKEYQDYIKSKK